MAKELPALTDRVIRRLKNTRAVAIAIVAGTAIGFVAQSTESIDKILVALKYRPDALSLTRESQRDELSRQFTQPAWRRLFWMRNYLARVARGVTKEEQDFAWAKHVEASEEWTSRTMVCLEALDHFYGEARAACFESQLQPKFNRAGSTLADFRYSPPSQPDARAAGIKTLNETIDDLNLDLYAFVRGFRSRTDRRPTTGCS